MHLVELTKEEKRFDRTFQEEKESWPNTKFLASKPISIDWAKTNATKEDLDQREANHPSFVLIEDELAKDEVVGVIISEGGTLVPCLS